MSAAISGFGSPHLRIGAVAVLATMVLAACSSGSGGNSTTASPTLKSGGTPTAAATPSPTESAAASASTSASSVPVAYDPCQIVTANEASTLSGATFSSGAESSTGGGGKLCTYSAAGVVVEVLIGQAPDVATAQAEESNFKTQIETGISQAGVVHPTVTELPGFDTGVDAAVLQGGATVQGITVSAIALYALKGTVFVAISEVTVGGTPPTSDAIQAQGHTSLGRISG